MEGRVRQRSKNRAGSAEPVSSVSTRRSANGVANSSARRKAAVYEMGMDNSHPGTLAAIDILATSLIGKPRMPQTTAHAVFARPRKGRSSRDNPAKPRIITYETLLPLFRLKLPEACKQLVSVPPAHFAGPLCVLLMPCTHSARCFCLPHQPFLGPSNPGTKISCSKK